MAVSRYDWIHIFHAATTYFDNVFIKYFMHFIVGWEVFYWKVEKILTNVRFHAPWIWRIKPYYVPPCSLTIFFLKTLVSRCILQLLFETTLVQCVLVIEIDLSNAALLDEVSDILFVRDFGNCFRTFGGWLDCLLI